jgi:hypothetical protein
LSIKKIAAASALAVLSAGTIVTTIATTTASAKPSFTFGTVTAKPAKNLINGQSVKVTVTNFNDPDGTTLYVAQCPPTIVADQDATECDQRPSSVKNPTTTGGAATAIFHVETGKFFKPTSGSAKCDPKHPCYIVVTDGVTTATTNYAGFATLDFGKKTKTVLSGKSTIKAGKTLHLTATTTKFASPLTGKVVLKDGSKKLDSATEKPSGIVKFATSKLKRGTHKLSAIYSGNSDNKSSKGTLKVVVTK